MPFALLIAFAIVPATAIRLQALDTNWGADEPVQKFEGLSTHLSAMAVPDNIETVVLYDSSLSNEIKDRAIFCYEVVTDYTTLNPSPQGGNFGSIKSGTEYVNHCLKEDGLLQYLNKKSKESRKYVKSVDWLQIDGGAGASCSRHGYTEKVDIPANDKHSIQVSIWSLEGDNRVRDLFQDKNKEKGKDYRLMKTYILDECKHDILSLGTTAKFEQCFGEPGKCKWACKHLVDEDDAKQNFEYGEACEEIIDDFKRREAIAQANAQLKGKGKGKTKGKQL